MVKKEHSHKHEGEAAGAATRTAAAGARRARRGARVRLFAPDEELAGRYQIARFLGRGGMEPKTRSWRFRSRSRFSAGTWAVNVRRSAD
jgi:hypothetical protein